MPEDPRDPRAAVDALVNSPGREGLTGTAPADVYARRRERETITTPPDQGPPDQQPAWREDFPIDWPQDQYIERRDFMKFLVLTSFALAAGQVWIAAQNWRRRRRGRPEMRRVASLDALPVGGALVFQYPGEFDNCLLVRLSDAELVAYSQKCTHLSCAVVLDLRSGSPTAGPPRRPLPRILLEVRGRDVFATGVQPRTI
jgi:hypothetical protein